jgi:MoaD family protein
MTAGRSGEDNHLEGEDTMTVQVRIPTPLRTLTQGNEEVSAQGQTLAEVIDDLEKNYPGMKERLLDENGVRRFVNIYANEEDVRFLDNLSTELKDGDTVSIVPAIAGGACRS